MPQLKLIKVNGGFAPFTKESKESFEKIPLKSVVVANVRLPRNGAFHKKFFAMLRVVAENIDSDENILLDYLKEKLGLYKVVAVGGVVMKRYESISFSSMDEIEFEKFYQKSLVELSSLLKINQQDLLNEFE